MQSNTKLEDFEWNDFLVHFRTSNRKRVPMGRCTV